MFEEQKNIIESLLKEKGITKRELAKRLGIKENSINRTLKNPSISLLKLGVIADALEVDIQDLLPKRETAQEPVNEFRLISHFDTSNQLTINNLSEAMNRNSKTIEKLVRIIADNFPDKNLESQND